jgi:hypothetical protein
MNLKRVFAENFGSKAYYQSLDDSELMYQLADLVVPTNKRNKRGVDSLLSVIFERVRFDRDAHPGLDNVAHYMKVREDLGRRAQLEGVADYLRGYYSDRHPEVPIWRSIPD